MAATLERTSADVISIENIVSQKSGSDVWVSARRHPLEAKGWVLARGGGFARHPSSSDADAVTPERGCGEHTQVIAIAIGPPFGLGLVLIVVFNWRVKQNITNAIDIPREQPTCGTRRAKHRSKRRQYKETSVRTVAAGRRGFASPAKAFCKMMSVVRVS